MKKIIKSFRQFTTTTLVFMLVFIIPGVLLPLPEKIVKVMSPDPEEMKLFVPLLLILACYITISYNLLIKNSNWNKKIFFLKLLSANLIIFPLMGFLESIFWIDAFTKFKGLRVLDFISIFFPFVITFTLFSVYLTLIYKANDIEDEFSKKQENVKQIIGKILVCGVAFFIIYNLAGYFIAWQFEATRVFYTASPEIKSFLPAMLQNISDSKFVLIHYLRGVLFGTAGYTIYSLLNGSVRKKGFIMALIFGGFGFQIILPNPLFPEMVRISHFLETTSSMLLFGYLMTIIFSYKSKLV